jgi:hypothetical protein
VPHGIGLAATAPDLQHEVGFPEARAGIGQAVHHAREIAPKLRRLDLHSLEGRGTEDLGPGPEERHRAPPIVRYVYVIGPQKGLQKIGMATDPQIRLATLQTASPHDLLIHAAIAVPFGAAPDVEGQAHRLLGRMCVRNEWFDITPAEALFAVYTAALPWMERRTSRLAKPPTYPETPNLPPALTSFTPTGRSASEDMLPLFQRRDF